MAAFNTVTLCASSVSKAHRESSAEFAGLELVLLLRFGEDQFLFDQLCEVDVKTGPGPPVWSIPSSRVKVLRFISNKS